MLAALLTTLLFAISAICGHRSATQIGGVEANFWRIGLATLFLALWANLFGDGIAGDAFPLFALSGLFGIGLGDTGYFQALPRLGSRRTVLLVQCFTPPFAALIEWLWLGTKLNPAEIISITVILAGVIVALAPGDHLKIEPHRLKTGIICSLIAAFGGALGVVLSRKAYYVLQAAGQHLDPGTTGYQRVLGGILVPGGILIALKWRSARAHGGILEEKTLRISREKWKRIWPWVLANSLAGQTLGVTAMQWAIEHTPTGIVTAIVATTPIVLLPMTRLVDGEKIGIRSLAGALIAVAGVIALAHFHVRA
ncbi:MAG TPA: DMT family transporter [Verrucomicrobiae bacterium]|nr:DMT family transporter [Verrucomicrobiae bacterium]